MRIRFSIRGLMVAVAGLAWLLTLGGLAIGWCLVATWTAAMIWCFSRIGNGRFGWQDWMALILLPIGSLYLMLLGTALISMILGTTND